MLIFFFFKNCDSHLRGAVQRVWANFEKVHNLDFCFIWKASLIIHAYNKSSDEILKDDSKKKMTWE